MRVPTRASPPRFDTRLSDLRGAVLADRLGATRAETIGAELAPVPAARALLATGGEHGAGDLVALRERDLGADEDLGEVTAVDACELGVELGRQRELGASGLRGLLGKRIGGQLVGLREGGAGLGEGVVGAQVRSVCFRGERGSYQSSRAANSWPWRIDSGRYAMTSSVV